MKNVLILAYYFPPLGMGGTQRAAKFAKYLPHFGWNPIVVTVKDVAYYAKDSTLLEDVRAVQIHRTGSLDPLRLLYLFGKGESASASSGGGRRMFAKLLSWVLVPDARVLWLPFAFLRALRVLRTQDVACLLTTSPPHSVHLLGLLLRKMKRVKWVADFRDGWSGGNFQYEPTPLHKWLNRTCERLVLRYADEVIAVSEGLKENLAAAVLQGRGRFHTITNGFDQEDFEELPELQRDDRFNIVYSGALTSMAPVAGFLQAIKALVARDPAAREKLRVRFVGADLEGVAAQQVSEFGLDDIVEFLGFLPHRRSLEKVRTADLLLYPVSNEASADFVPGKTFEYMASRKRILAVGAETEGLKILQRHGSVVCLAHDDMEGMANAIHSAMAGEWTVESSSPDAAALAFERKRLAGRLAEILELCLCSPKV